MSKRPSTSDGRAILIVDADAESRRIVQDMLAHHGHTTIATASGDEALSVARSVLPLVVVTELYVSNREHLCLVYALRADVRLRRVPVVVFTAFAMPVDREWAESAEVAAYLTKPAAPRSLLAEVERVAQMRGYSPRQAH